MAASLTLSAVAIAADGKTITATIAGGTAPYSVSSTAGLLPHLSGGSAYAFPLASAAVSGSTLTVVTYTPVGTGETIQFDITASSTLTDSAANTPTGQTNLAVSNSSAVAVTTLMVGTNTSAFELNGAQILQGEYWRGVTTWLGSNAVDQLVELVAHATEVAVLTNSSVATTARIDGATASTTLPTTSATWAVKPLTTSPLTVGKHLFEITTDYFAGVRLSGGNRTTHTVPTVKATPIGNGGSLLQIPGPTTQLNLTGAWRVNSASAGNISIGSYGGARVEFGFTGSGVEVAATAQQFSSWAAVIDGGQPGALKPAGDSSVSNQNVLFPLASGLTSGAHTISATQVSAGVGSFISGIKVINGTTLSSAAASGATTVVVADASTIAVGDWVKIDDQSKRERRQVTVVSGTTLTINAALSQAHAVGATLTSYSAPVGTVSAWKTKTYSKLLVAIGDSNTQGANEYGLNGTADPSGNFYNAYDPRMAVVFYAADPLGIEVANLGIQGNTTATMVGRDSDIANYARSSTADYIVVWAGTNDINGTTTPAAFQSSLDSLVTAAIPSLKAGGAIIVMPPGTPSTTNSNGLNLATALSACQAVAANHAGTNIVVPTNLFTGLVSGDYNSLHYFTSGRQKVAVNLSPYIGGASISAAVLTGMFAAV